MKTKNNFIFSIIFTLLFAIFIFWNRFFRLRLPRSIEMQPYFNLHCFFILVFFIGSFSLFLYYLLKFLKLIPRPRSRLSSVKNRILLYISNKPQIMVAGQFIYKTVINGPTTVYDYLYQYIYMRPFIQRTGSFLVKYFTEKPIIPYILFLVLPKLIPWFILLFEIIYYQHITYFYKALILYLIPLLFNIILYMIKHHAIFHIKYYKEYFEFKQVENTIHVFLKSSTDSQFLDEQEKLCSRAGTEWEFYQYHYNITFQINYRKNHYQNILNLIMYALMSISFLSQLYFLIGIRIF